MSSTTSGELALTKYSSGEKPWDHSSGLDTIDTQVSRLLRGRFKAASSLGNGDTTPSVQNLAVVKTGSSAPTSVTDFDDGSDEQILIILGNDGGNTTIVHDDTNIRLAGAANLTIANDEVLVLLLDGTKWCEVSNQVAASITSAQLASNSVVAAKIATASVGSTKLIYATASGTISPSSVLSLGAVNAHLPLFEFYQGIGGSPSSGRLFGGRYATSSTFSAACFIVREGGTEGVLGYTAYSVPYHSSSPPHMLCGEEWGSFMFLLRRKSDGYVLSSMHSNDPVWRMDNSGMWKKNDPRLIAALPHPFPQYDPSTEEIVLVDMREHDFEEAPFSQSRERAKVIRREAQAMAGSDLAGAVQLFGEAEREEKSEPAVKMRRMFSIMEKSRLFGDSPWMYHSTRKNVMEASGEALKDGKPMKTGVPAFDDVVTIVRA